MSVFLGADLVGGNYPNRAAFTQANAPTQIFVDTLKGLRTAGDGAVNHTNAAVGGAGDHEIPGQYAAATGKPFNLAFLGLGMNSGSLYGMYGRGPNALFTRDILREFVRARKAEGVLPIVCNTIHPWPEKMDPAAEAGVLIEGLSFPAERSTLYTHIGFTLNGDTMRVEGLDADGRGFFDQKGPGSFIRAGSQLRFGQDARGNTGQMVTVASKIDGSTIRLSSTPPESGTFWAFVQHYAPPVEEIMAVPPSKQRQLKDWTGSGVQVEGLGSYAEWNAILRDLCQQEDLKLIDFEYRGFRWVEQHGWASVYKSVYQGEEFETFNHPQYAAQRVVYGDMMRWLAQQYNSGALTGGFEVLRGPAVV